MRSAYLNISAFDITQVKDKELTVATLKQQYIFIPSQVGHVLSLREQLKRFQMRVPYLVNLVRTLEEGSSIIIFTSTCESCEEIAITLRELELNCVSLHSLMSQAQRLASLSKFKSAHVPILVATGTTKLFDRSGLQSHLDVASRGLDIPKVRYVINSNIPLKVEDYIHRCDIWNLSNQLIVRRVGRTARAGRGGSSISIVTEHDVKLVHAIESHIGVKLGLYEQIEVS